MAALLIRLFLFILILWLLRRVLGNLFSPTRRPEFAENVTEAPNNMVKDRVCGMYMDSRLAIRIDSRKEEFYFCSEECKNRYLKKSAARM